MIVALPLKTRKASAPTIVKIISLFRHALTRLGARAIPEQRTKDKEQNTDLFLFVLCSLFFVLLSVVAPGSRSSRARNPSGAVGSRSGRAPRRPRAGIAAVAARMAPATGC